MTDARRVIISYYVKKLRYVRGVGSALRGVNNQIPDEPAKIICEYLKKVEMLSITFDEKQVEAVKVMGNDFMLFYSSVRAYLPKDHQPSQTGEERCAMGGDSHGIYQYIGGKA